MAFPPCFLSTEDSFAKTLLGSGLRRLLRYVAIFWDLPVLEREKIQNSISRKHTVLEQAEIRWLGRNTDGWS